MKLKNTALTKRPAKVRQFDLSARLQIKCYLLDGVTYVPHIKKAGYTYPGMAETAPPVGEQLLLNAGAKNTSEWLYPNLYGQPIDPLTRAGL